MKTPAAIGHLCLADGTVFTGRAWGASGVAVGEVVFTTGMTGYQEVLTDPSYTGQLVTMTAPEIGNTGVNDEDAESVSSRPSVAGFLVRHLSEAPSNWRATGPAGGALDAYLARHNVVALSEIDTRLLTRKIRDGGSQNGAMGAAPIDELVDRARAAPAMEGLDLVRAVTPAASYPFTESSGVWSPGNPLGSNHRASAAAGAHIVAMDLGMKRNILRCFVDRGCKVTVVPATMPANEILKMQPDGVFVSNGPGDPAAAPYAYDTVRALLGKKPLFGICLGHQLLGLALGARTYKLKFGHRGLNQPVLDLTTGKVEITSQNHGFAVDVDSLPKEATTTHVHLNDRTSEGLEVPELDAFSVQYHPEAAAGPHDAHYLFDRFLHRVASPKVVTGSAFAGKSST